MLYPIELEARSEKTLYQIGRIWRKWKINVPSVFSHTQAQRLKTTLPLTLGVASV